VKLWDFASRQLINSFQDHE
jgi:centriolar protein POC1